MCKGFVKIPRRIYEEKQWNVKRVYSELDAFYDIYASANTRDRTEADGTKIKRNQLSVSYRTLAEKWIWAKSKVDRFLSSLERKGYITVETTKQRTIVTIIDFGQDIGTQSGTQGGTPTETHLGHQNTDRHNGFKVVDGTPTETQGGTPTETLSRVYKNDNYISCLNEEDKKEDSSLCSESEKEIDDYPFEKFWDLYEKKRGLKKAKALYDKLSVKDRKEIFEYIPRYKAAQPDKQFRKDPETFLRNRSWEDEIIDRHHTFPQMPIGFNLKNNDNPDKYKNEKGW